MVRYLVSWWDLEGQHLLAHSSYPLHNHYLPPEDLVQVVLISKGFSLWFKLTFTSAASSPSIQSVMLCPTHSYLFNVSLTFFHLKHKKMMLYSWTQVKRLLCRDWSYTCKGQLW